MQTHRISLVSPSSPPPPYEQQLPLNPSAPTYSSTAPEMESQEEISSRSQGKQPGNRRCDSDTCVTCDLLNTGTTFRSTMTGKDYKFMPHVSCHTKNIIYLVRTFDVRASSQKNTNFFISFLGNLSAM